MKKLILFLTFTLLLFYSPALIYADACSSLPPSQEKNDCYQKILDSLASQANTLAGQIAFYDAQIKLVLSKITQTEDQIVSISAKINFLEDKLQEKSRLLETQIRLSYKQGQLDPLRIFLSSDDVSQLISRFKYLQIVQSTNRRFLAETQTIQNSYAQQKTLIQDSQKKLDAQKKNLASIKVERDNLLKQTKKSEVAYQKLLQQARLELEAITAVLAGRGIETKIGDINQGDKIATIISGSSCNSGGSHLHFIVKNGNNVENPFNYLKPTNYSNCSGSSCGSSDGDPFNPRGSWDWPLNSPITLNQGYGSTWATIHTWVRNIYSFHNGIDIVGSSSDVKAVQSGTLYRGSFTGSGCRLPYARVQHKDSDISTFYLHVQ